MGIDIIAFDRPSANSCTCRRRYRRKASLFQRPSSMIVGVGTLARYRSMAQLDLIECVPTLESSMPNDFVPIFETVSFMCCRVWVAEMRTRRFVFGFRNVLTVLSPVVLGCCSTL